MIATTTTNLLCCTLECCKGQVMPSRARPFPQTTLLHPSRSHQSGSRYRPAPVHLCPDPVPVLQTELSPSRRDSLNFTTPTADRCPRDGGLFLWNTSLPGRCTRSVSVSSVWDGESGKWQSGNSDGPGAIDTSVCSLLTHGTNHNILSHYRGITVKQTPVTRRDFKKCNPDLAGIPTGLYRSHSHATLYWTHKMINEHEKLSIKNSEIS